MLRNAAFILVLLGVIGTCQMASAQSLEDVLKEKGVITKEDYKRIVKNRQVKYKAGNGLTLSSPDGKNSVTIGGQMQPQYDFKKNEVKEDLSKFEIKRIKIWLMGHAFSKDLTYKLQMRISNIQGADIKNGGLMEEAKINYKHHDSFQILFGQTKARFGRQGILSSKKMHLVDKSQVTKAFFPTYDTGVMAHGKIAEGLLYYEGFVSGGAGQNTWRETSHAALNARLAVNPLGYMKYAEGDLAASEKPLVSFAANIYRNRLHGAEMEYGDANHLGFLAPKKGWYAIGNSLGPSGDQITDETVEIDMYGLDMALTWQGFWLQAEYLKGQAEGERSKNEVKAAGFYLQSSVFVISKKLALGYRYSQFDPNDRVDSDNWVENTAGVSWYIKGNAVKLQADYTSILKEATLAKKAEDTNDKRIRVQMQLLY